MSCSVFRLVSRSKNPSTVSQRLSGIDSSVLHLLNGGTRRMLSLTSGDEVTYLTDICFLILLVLQAFLSDATVDLERQIVKFQKT